MNEQIKAEERKMRSNRIELWRDQIRNAWGEDFQDADAIVDSLLADVRAEEAERVAEQIDRLLDGVRALHGQVRYFSLGPPARELCAHCGHTSPCPTLAALSMLGEADRG